MPKNSPLPDDDEELVHYDDRLIGNAFRWSLVALIIIAVLFGGAVFILKRKPAAAAPQMTKLNAPVSPVLPQAEVPEAKFTDITKEAGITFTHVNGAYGEKLLPETMGGGVAFLTTTTMARRICFSSIRLTGRVTCRLESQCPRWGCITTTGMVISPM